MRTAMAAVFLPFTAWLGALQATTSSWNSWSSIDNSARIVGMAGVLGTLSVLIYRLGVWRQEMENTRNNVGAELKAYHEESTMHFDRLERRLDAIDHMVSMATDFKDVARRRQARTDRRVMRLEQSLQRPTE
ncbi:MAG: hypothetical protein ABJE47_08875 [bacterium]